MNFDIITLFPEMFFGPLQDGILRRARRHGRIGVRLHDLRRWGVGKHRIVDDTPYGGGGGMVLKPEPFFDAVDWIKARYPAENDRIVLLSPQGAKLSHSRAKEMTRFDRVILLCGRYEGVDERVRTSLADEEMSVGDVVLSGGELPAMLVVGAVSRFVSGVLGRSEAADFDSFANGQLDYPYYTRPAEFREERVPECLLSGDHGAIMEWRARMALEATRSKRPDLLERGGARNGSVREG